MAGRPSLPAGVPPVIVETLRTVWETPYATTYRATATAGAHDLFLKRAADLRQELERIEWLGRHVPTAEVLAFVSDDGVDWLVTKGIPGHPAHDRDRLPDVERMVDAVAAALHLVHAIPAEACPFVTAHGGGPSDDDVVLHGDAALPNVLLDEDYSLAGFVDVGDCGRGSRWEDVPQCIASLQRPGNRAPGAWHRLLDAYGVEPPAGQVDLWRAGARGGSG